jgi:small-conductance mechanosensitive channel/uncharacterized protein YndB with AHSA1/START domain
MRSGLFAITCLLITLPAAAQEPFGFDDIAAAAELEQITTQIQGEDVTNSLLADARSRTVRLETGATGCAADATAERSRLEARFEPLRDIDSELDGAEVWDQRQEIRAALDEAITRQARCTGIIDNARALGDRITSMQNTLSQQFLSSRTQTVIGLAKDLPRRMPEWPARIRGSFELQLIEGVTASKLLWLLIIVGAVAASAGLLLRHRFRAWYQAAGGNEAPPSLKFLVPKPVAEFAPLWLESAALLAVLFFTLTEPTNDLIVMRLAWALLLFSVGCVVINWSTGPLSPSAGIRGLIPDHVRPIRLRLRFVLLAICSSYVVVGEQWAMVRISEPYIAGRALTIFLVGIALITVLDYARHVPGLRERFKVLRFLALTITSLGIIAVLVGFQNLAAFLVYGVTRTGVALYITWIVLWLVSIFLQYLLRQDTPAADQVRSSLGLSGRGSRTGIGFIQLIADVVVWMTFAIYMIFVWDDSGTTLGQMYIDFVVGWEIGGVSLVPLNMIGGILIFAGIIVVIGWLKRWIDKRWLQHIVFDRGSRDAIITLFGYVGFVIALLVALFMAEVDLSGLAWVSAALALGIGFGMQEIASNFVSGLILLFERPIRAGDFVTVGDIQGFVRSIRIRATEIETLDNQNVLVPNSELISGRVTNWVLRDTYGRLLVNVGVAYGSDVEKVRDILETVAREHPEVITDGSAPAPRALFMGFGDSSLDFELRVRVKHIERRFSIKSDLNFEIDKLFRESGITIPFPQRDLHIIEPQAATPETRVAAVHETDTASSPAQGPGTRSHTEKLETAADIDRVWAAVTDIDIMKRWIARDGTFSPHVGGAFNLALRDGYEIAGRLDIFIPPRRMRAAIVPLGDEAPLPTGPITIEIVLRKKDAATELTVIVSGIPDSEDWEEYYRLSVDRWEIALLELRKNVLGK